MAAENPLPPSEPMVPEAVALSEFSRLRLALFRAEEALECDALDEVLRLIDGIEASIQCMLGQSLDRQVEQLGERLEFIEGSVSKDAFKACKDELDTIRSLQGVGLRERAERLRGLQQAIAGLFSDRPKLVCKVNVFDHGRRDLIEINDGDTVATLQALIKEKFAQRIEEYLYSTHQRRVSPGEVNIRVYADGAAAGSNDELGPDVLLAAIPKHATEGVTWYPELAGADPADYLWTK